MLRIILVSPEGEYNVGFVARLCANFSIRELFLVSPKCNLKEAERFAMKGIEILREAVVVDSLEDAIRDVSLKVATSSIADIEGDPLRRSIRPWYLGKIYDGRKTALIFGRESVGLTREEIRLADYLVFIPSNESYPVLNLSHAVSIILYELFTYSMRGGERIGLASGEALSLIDKYIKEVVELVYRDGRDRKRALEATSRVIKRGFPDESEARTISRFFRKISLALKRSDV